MAMLARSATVKPLSDFAMFVASLLFFFGRSTEWNGLWVRGVLFLFLHSGFHSRRADRTAWSFLWLFAVLALAACAQTSWRQASSQLPERFWGKVSGVESGHTLVVQEGDRTHRVHLYGVVSPSKGTPKAGKASRFLQEMAFGQIVQVEPVPPRTPKDIYAIVYMGEKTLNEEMIRQGLAWIHPRTCTLPVCKEWRSVEEEAKTSGKGLWADPRAVPPWEGGKKKRGL